MLELVNQGLYQDQTDQYAKITDCVPRAAMQSGIGVENIIPAAPPFRMGARAISATHTTATAIILTLFMAVIPPL